MKRETPSSPTNLLSNFSWPYRYDIWVGNPGMGVNQMTRVSIKRREFQSDDKSFNQMTRVQPNDNTRPQQGDSLKKRWPKATFWNDKSFNRITRVSIRWLDFHQMTRLSSDDKTFIRWQDFHRMTRLSSDD